MSRFSGGTVGLTHPSDCSRQTTLHGAVTPSPYHDDMNEGRSENLATEAAVVLDPLLAEVWQTAWSAPPGPETLGILLRLAYLRGYCDGSADPAGTLLRRLGCDLTGSRSGPTRRGEPSTRSSGT